MSKRGDHGDSRRSERFNRTVREEVSRMLQSEIRDPRIGDVTITDVATTDDLRHCRIYYTAHHPDEERVQAIQQGLDRAEGFMRGRLSRVLRIRYAPRLEFIYDQSIDYGERIENLLEELTPGESDED